MNLNTSFPALDNLEEFLKGLQKISQKVLQGTIFNFSKNIPLAGLFLLLWHLCHSQFWPCTLQGFLGDVRGPTSVTRRVGSKIAAGSITFGLIYLNFVFLLASFCPKIAKWRQNRHFLSHWVQHSLPM